MAVYFTELSIAYCKDGLYLNSIIALSRVVLFLGMEATLLAALVLDQQKTACNRKSLLSFFQLCYTPNRKCQPYQVRNH